MTENTPPARRSNAVLASFSGPCLPLAAFGVALPVTLPEFYATHVGLSIGMVGAMFMAVRLIDILFDPLVGWGMDQTKTRFGRYRPWMAVSTPILMLAALMIFVMVRPGAGPGYLFLWLLVLYIGFSIGTLSQLGWASVLAPQYDQRSRVYAWWQAFNIIGVIAILILPTAVIQLGIGDYIAGVHIMGWAIIIALPLTIGLAMLAVPEPMNAGAAPHGGARAYLDLLKRPTVVKLLTADLLLGIAPGITGALLFFFFGQVKGYDRTEASIFMLLYFIGGLVGSPIWAWLAGKVGKDKALAIASLIFAALYFGATLLPGGNFALTAGAMFIAGLPYAAGLFLLRAMMADAGDEVRLETGVDRTGLMFSILSATTKIGHVVALIPYLILQVVGFEAVAPAGGNSPTSLLVLQVLFIAIPALLIAAAAWVLKGYPLTPDRHADIRRQLDAREATMPQGAT
ncbi:MFS transporter [Brevundimonas variabilis]|uniref:Na+/melibiose symporter-like transporter n=1 Tax=Brevundimonas variabilis TaxID=74312 RepID=A0A7W9FDU7_9CAUL|nr:MFS transporter [Brevundimonas variabilis]MBB5745617.1 Na+/melibiose symporter-like transporter [Brevundimonas variabilis]